MGAGPLCCIAAKAQYKNKAPLDSQPHKMLTSDPNHQFDIKPSEEVSNQLHTQSRNEGNYKTLSSNNDKGRGALNNQQLQNSKGEGSKTMESNIVKKDGPAPLKESIKALNQEKKGGNRMDFIHQKENFQLNNVDILDQSLGNNKGGKNKESISVIQAAQKKQKEPSLICESISRINCTLRSSSLLNATGQGNQNKKRKKKGKKKKIGGASKQQVPHQSSVKNQSSIMNKMHSKSNVFNNESRSVDFQVTYIERKQDSFYGKGSITNQTNFLRSGNVTDANMKVYISGGGGLNSHNITSNGNTNNYGHGPGTRNISKYMNQKSQFEDEKIIDLMGKGGEYTPNNQSLNYIKKKQLQLPNQSSITQKAHHHNPKSNNQIASPYFNQDGIQDEDDDIITTKQQLQHMKQYPIVGNEFDDFDVDNDGEGNGAPRGDQSEFDEEDHQDDDTFKEEVSPNEACYIDVDPIEPNTLIPLNDSQARAKAMQYKELSKRINDAAFEVWDSATHQKMRFYTDKQSFVDASTKSSFLTFESSERSWKRINEISMNPGVIKEKLQPGKVFAGEASNEATICAITAVINHDIKFSTDFIGSALHPHNNGKPILNSFGKYGVKLFLNGEQRLVEIDDMVLYNNRKKQISMCYYEKDQSEFSLSLVEKAYLKVYGGSEKSIDYNPSIDIHFLTNWIPETVHFDDVSNKDNLWTRLIQNFRDQNIIICLQTINEQAQGGLDFYSVLDLIESHDMRIIQCKCATKGSKKLMRFIKDTDKLPLPFKREQALAMETGVFYVVWTEEISNYFNSISLCWNTKIYPYSQCIHSKFNFKSDYNSKMHNDTYSMYYNPQILFTIPPHQEDFEVRIMLRRHVKDYFQRNTISFKLFTFDGHRIVYPMETLRTFNYPTREICSDVFIFENSQEYESYVLVLSAEDEVSEKYYDFFTLDVFSFISLDLKELPVIPIDKQYQVYGKWRCEDNPQLVGGTILSHKYIYNPQYSLKVHETTHVQIKVETDPFNSVMLMIYESGKDATEAPFQSILANKNQGFFFKGFSFLETVLEAKEYTIVICPETQEQKGEYKLEISKIISPKYDYVKEFQIAELKVNDYKYKQEIDGKWNVMNSKGTNRILTDEFQAFMKNPGYIVHVREPTKARCQLVPTDPIVEGHEIPSVSICVFELLDEEGYKFRIILEDDHYAGKAWGFFTEEFELTPNKNGYLFLCINFDRGVEGNFKFTFMSIIFILSNITLIGEQLLRDKIVDFNEVFYKKHTEQYIGEWSTELQTTGGCSQEHTFFKNPCYLIVTKKNTQALFQVESPDQYPVGMVLFEIDRAQEHYSKGGVSQKSLSQIDYMNLAQNPRSNSTFLIEVNTLTTPLKANKSYLLIPTTYKSGMEGKFVLTVSLDSEFSLTEIKEPILNRKHHTKGRFEKVNHQLQPLPTLDINKIKEVERLPHFWFNVVDQTEIRIQLYAQDEIGVRFMLYKIEETGEYKLVQSQNEFSFFRIGSFIYLKGLMPTPKGYLIICQQSDPAYQGEFYIDVETKPNALSKFIKDFLLYDGNSNNIENNNYNVKGSGFNTPLESNHSEREMNGAGGSRLGPSNNKGRKVIKKTSIIKRHD